MKLLKSFLLLFLASVLLISCSQNRVVVATDHNLEDAHFDQYSSFTFAEHINDASKNSYFWDSELMKLEVKKEVLSELESLGYDYVQSGDADLLVNFRVFDKDMEFQGWTGNFAEDNYWGPFYLRETSRQPDDAKTYYLDKGTILVQMVDIKQGILVWQGYASGIVKNAQFRDDERESIDEAVEEIFEKFAFKAPGSENE